MCVSFVITNRFFFLLFKPDTLDNSKVDLLSGYFSLNTSLDWNLGDSDQTVPVI